MTVHFEDVGRDHKSWSSEMSSLSDKALIREIRKETTVMSHMIEFLWDEEGISAQILVGWVRKIGRVRVEGGMKL